MQKVVDFLVVSGSLGSGDDFDEVGFLGGDFFVKLFEIIGSFGEIVVRKD